MKERMGQKNYLNKQEQNTFQNWQTAYISDSRSLLNVSMIKFKMLMLKSNNKDQILKASKQQIYYTHTKNEIVDITLETR